MRAEGNRETLIATGSNVLSHADTHGFAGYLNYAFGEGQAVSGGAGLEAFQLAAHVGREHVRTRGGPLAPLNEGRPCCLQRLPVRQSW